MYFISSSFLQFSVGTTFILPTLASMSTSLYCQFCHFHFFIFLFKLSLRVNSPFQITTASSRNAVVLAIIEFLKNISFCLKDGSDHALAACVE